MTPHPLAPLIPDELLWVADRSDHARRRRAHDLLDWCERHGWRPTFAELEDERRRRSEEHITRDGTVPSQTGRNHP